MPGVRLQRIVQEEILAGEALAGHHVGVGAEIGHVQRMLRGGRLLLLSQGKVQADGVFETVGPVKAVGPGENLVGGQARRSDGHGNGDRIIDDMLGLQGNGPGRYQEKYARQDALHLSVACKITNLF